MARQFISGAFFAFIALLVAYVLMSAYVALRLGYDTSYTYLLTNGLNLRRLHPDIFVHVWAGMLFMALAGFIAGTKTSTEKLLKIGVSDWQSKKDIKKHGLLGEPGRGFIMAKTCQPEKQGKYITSKGDKFANCMVVAPTGAGKGVGFVYPNLLTFDGSTVTLDIKGENYEVTAKWRKHAMENEVFRFAPAMFGEDSHRYNPLERIGKITDYSQRMFELRKIATLFLKADSAGEWLNGAIQLFTACGGIAYLRQDFTLGGIHKVLTGGAADIQKHIRQLAAEAAKAGVNALAQELAGLGKLETKTLSSYQSVMQNAGFDQWGNPHIAEMTSKSDFSFADLRRKKTSIYIVISDPDLDVLASLVRLFFNELVATLQQSKPKKDEPYQVMMILDEFHRLGQMERVANAMTTIRGFGGRIAIITQTIPALDLIYSREARLSIQGGAGLKLYMTPSEEMTISDLSQACGMTTARTLGKSRKVGLVEETTYTEGSDERPLLTEDAARQLPADVTIIIVKGQQPIKANPIIHHEDPTFTTILRKMEGMSWKDMAYPGVRPKFLKFLEDIEKEFLEADLPKAEQVTVVERMIKITEKALEIYEKLAKYPSQPPQSVIEHERIKLRKPKKTTLNTTPQNGVEHDGIRLRKPKRTAITKRIDVDDGIKGKPTDDTDPQP